MLASLIVFRLLRSSFVFKDGVRDREPRGRLTERTWRRRLDVFLRLVLFSFVSNFLLLLLDLDLLDRDLDLDFLAELQARRRSLCRDRRSWGMIDMLAITTSDINY